MALFSGHFIKLVWKCDNNMATEIQRDIINVLRDVLNVLPHMIRESSGAREITGVGCWPSLSLTEVYFLPSSPGSHQ